MTPPPPPPPLHMTAPDTYPSSLQRGGIRKWVPLVMLLMPSPGSLLPDSWKWGAVVHWLLLFRAPFFNTHCFSWASLEFRNYSETNAKYSPDNRLLEHDDNAVERILHLLSLQCLNLERLRNAVEIQSEKSVHSTQPGQHEKCVVPVPCSGRGRLQMGMGLSILHIHRIAIRDGFREPPPPPHFDKMTMTKCSQPILANFHHF